MIAKSFRTLVLVAAAAMMAKPAVAGGEHVPPVKEFIKDNVNSWLSDPQIIAAIKAQNAKHASLTNDQIIKLDKDWRAQVDAGTRPLIDKLLSSKLSKFLKSKKEESGGTITEIFVMDNKGLNVGQSDATSDYWQGDEAKWKKTYGVGPKALHISDPETDDSTQTLQSQASLTIADPATGKPIGAVTIGINLGEL